MPQDPQAILRRLRELDRKDAKRSVFGAMAHQYKLNPPLPVSVIEEFEGHHAIRLPDDYRTFVTEVGNGGAGPSYGLFPFGQQDDSFGLCTWDEGDLLGDPSEPFSHEDAWNLPDEFWRNEPEISPDMPPEEEDRLMEAWDGILSERYWNPSIMDGAIPICHLGCASRQWLVVNGQQKGYVWCDDRADDAGIRPLRDDRGEPVDFASWYTGWLQKALDGIDSKRRN